MTLSDAFSRSNLIKSSFFLVGITLLFKDQYSTIAFVLLLLIALYSTFKSTNNNKENKKKLLLVAIPFLLFFIRILGFINGEPAIALKETIRAIPFLLIPLSFVLLFTSTQKINFEKKLFYGLLTGAFIAMFICEYHVVSAMISQEEPLGYFFRWRHLNFNFTQPIDIHPAYFGILLVWLITITLYSDYILKKYRLLIVFFLVILLFQLVARNALLVTFLLLVVYFWKLNNKFLKFSFFSFIAVMLLIVVLHPSDYLRKKYFNTIENTTEDTNRFSRIEASINVFKMAPMLGVGPGNDDTLRVEEYNKIGDTIAFENRYNSHNQFIEYLSTYGVIGFSLFMLVLILLVLLLIRVNNKVYLFLLLAFIFSCLTESVLERTLGIKIFSILIGLIFIKFLNEKKETNLLNGSRS